MGQVGCQPKEAERVLPAWFRADAYEKARTFGALEWYQQLVLRKRMFDGFDACIASGDLAFPCLEKAFNFIHADPIVTEARVYAAAIRVSHPANMEPIPDDRAPLVFILGRTYIDPIIGSTVQPLEEPCVRALSNMCRDEIEPPLRQHSMDGTSSGVFTNTSDFSKWFESGILPYLDLFLWEKIGHSICWPAFIEELSYILDEPMSRGTALIKAAQDFARKLLEPETLRTLEAQAAYEYRCNTEESKKIRVS